jgi:hypothetical protein
MTDNSKLKYSILVAIAGIGVIAIFAIIGVFAFLFSPPSKPTPTVLPPTLSPSKQYQPEIIPLSTYTPNPARTSTVTPTHTLVPTFTPTTTPPYVPPVGKPLPDLIIANISDPVCASSNVDETPRNYIKLTVIVRNIGDASTHPFGSFDVGVYILLGQASYSLDEWANRYGGVIAYPNLTISNLDPNRDRTFTLAIDRKGITKFGIKAVANSRENAVPEMDRENNTLIKYFSVNCY